ncbi:MAG: transporter [Rhodanobacter sp.]|nr:MAG: transporter [Rhodanobacter sp.]
MLLALPAYAGNPGYDRPGYGFNPAVLGAGDVTIEQGLPDWTGDRQAGVRSSLYTADSLLRIGLGGPLELQLGSSPYNRLRLSGGGTDYTRHGRGDSHLGLKLALPSNIRRFSWGLLGSVEFTDGAPDFRNNRRQYLLGLELNLQANAGNALGAYVENVRAGGRTDTTLAFSDGYALTPRLTIYAQTALLYLAGQGYGSLAGTGLAWMVTPRVQLDTGVDRRLSGVASRWQGHLGVSVYLGR